MDRLLHLSHTLNELDPPRWPDPGDETTHLVRRVHQLRRVPLGELRPADLHMLITQQVGLPFVLPLAIRLLTREPLVDARFYEGDLLLAAVTAPAAAWNMLPDAAEQLRTVITSAVPQAAVAELPRGAAEQLTHFVDSRP
ncbi:contact-dependent growth inhibition system immunity protein [Streptomyces sp. ODS28]|uniref:contact-dependent growth inhibition system immunity protein n=1 Tax=Streptomyces sp. ODS28 TaxID=3136688 RepID=UPI0031F0DEFC